MKAEVLAGIHSKYFGFHRMLSQRFPFGIYYEVDEDVTYVYAILDMRKDPTGLKTALEGRK